MTAATGGGGAGGQVFCPRLNMNQRSRGGYELQHARSRIPGYAVSREHFSILACNIISYEYFAQTSYRGEYDPACPS